ncbi:fungal-specific transcription factor domain-containing protein [Flagelloscypha sp. PMI_526]|nr:fungal-specific transcription factor domain-containing protein [Flagelloscypha sp. PMI_526]
MDHAESAIRRAERHDTSLASRMARGLVACAECKRMKLKCDKKLPCSSCVRRGCSSICPTGKLTSGQGSRYILDGTHDLHAQNEQLRKRINQLEDALAVSHSQSSVETHPLLSQTGPGSTKEDAPSRKKRRDNVEETAEVFGTLAIGDAGQVKYFGPSAGTETLFQAMSNNDEPPSPEPPHHSLDPTLESLSLQFPFSFGVDPDTLVTNVLPHLPDRMRAWSLCELFLEHFAVFFSPIRRDELIQDYLSPIYKYMKDLEADPHLPRPLACRPHRCALIFLIFAIGSWVDLTKDQYWEDADKYFHIGRGCLAIQSIFNSPEVATVQSLLLLSSYAELRGSVSTATLDPTYTIVSLAAKIAQGLGLHRDNAKWKLDKTVVERRRTLFWELTCLEIFMSISTGRPPSIRQTYVDAELPEDAAMVCDAQGRPQQGFVRWKHEMVREHYSELLETILGTTPAKYETILELDRKIRAKALPGHLNTLLVDGVAGNKVGENLTPREYMQTSILGVFRSMLLLYIHRGFLSKALQDPTGNPLKSQYAPSFLACYRAASWMIKCIHAFQTRHQKLYSRLWHPWTNVMSAAMVLGTIVIHASATLMAKNALEELRTACSMFENAASQTLSHRTKNGYKLVHKILNRAEDVYARHTAGGSSVLESSLSIPLTEAGDDELALFGGQTRLLPLKSKAFNPEKSRLRHGVGSPDSSSSASTPSSTDDVPMHDVHQSLIDYLTTAPATQIAPPAMFQAMGTQSPPTSVTSVLPGKDPVPPSFESWMLPPSTDASTTDVPENTFNLWDFGSTSGLQGTDTFENYLVSTDVPMATVQQNGMNDQWQAFMMQSFLGGQ